MPDFGLEMGLGAYKCWKDTADRLSTSYVAVIGPETAWRGTKPLSLDQLEDPSRTILVIEKANSGIHWMEPRDVSIKGLPSRSNHEDTCVRILFADGTVTDMLSDRLDEASLKAELTD